jgi:hypothetical protein
MNPGPDWAEILPELGPEAGDVVVTKHHPCAFNGTDLDIQLRRRGIQTIVLCGVATNIGVEATARVGLEHGYNLVFAEDAMAARDAELHAVSVSKFFPTGVCASGMIYHPMERQRRTCCAARVVGSAQVLRSHQDDILATNLKRPSRRLSVAGRAHESRRAARHDEDAYQRRARAADTAERADAASRFRRQVEGRGGAEQRANVVENDGTTRRCPDAAPAGVRPSLRVT